VLAPERLHCPFVAELRTPLLDPGAYVLVTGVDVDARSEGRVMRIHLEPLTPPYVVGHAVWRYLAAVVYAVAGVLLLLGRYRRTATIGLGLTVLVVVLVVYVPIALVECASLDSFNFVADTLMFGGAVLLLAGSIQPGTEREQR
jgi:uncharacterized membrane protein YphA (DoxX/SURF4 family)